MRPPSLVWIWRRFPISRQLLVAVNSILIAAIGLLLWSEYRVLTARQLAQKQIALTEEAKTLYEALLALEPRGTAAMQRLVDDVCARMHSEESPGHHIAVAWGRRVLQARSHGQASPEMLSAMQTATSIPAGTKSGGDGLVVGRFRGPAGSVYVSERRTKVIAAVRQSLLMQIAAVLGLASIAAIIVNVVLQHVITSPIQQIVSDLRRIASGDLRVMTKGESCKELRFLVRQINAMTQALDAADQDRRLHMEKARQIQEYLLPTHRHWNGLSVAELFQPAADVGGDYYDIVQLGNDRVLICIADVAGHGVPAAMAATVLKTLVLEAVETTQQPSKVLTRINRRYSELILPGHLATMTVLVVDVRRRILSYANAGHEPPFLQDPNGNVRRLSISDLLLGVDQDVVYEEETLQVEAGSRIALVSDGVTETFNMKDEIFGAARVAEFLVDSRKLSVTETVERLRDRLTLFRGQRPAFDDTTLLVAEFTDEEQPLGTGTQTQEAGVGSTSTTTL